MIKNTIVQFVCFITNLELDEFIPEWERYTQKLLTKNAEPALMQQVATTKCKFSYISQHEWPERDFHFTFINDRPSKYFPENKVKILQTGGYIPVQLKRSSQAENDDPRLIAFISHNETDIDFYKRLPLYNNLNIYQAYYESCSYGYVLEFFVSAMNLDELMLVLNHRPGVETGLFKECLVPQV